MIFYGRQHIDQQDIKSVKRVLESAWLTQGPDIEEFEKKVAEYSGARYAVAVTNATSALHIACMAAGLKQGEVLWTSPITFTASANCGRYCGADVDFVDIDDNTYNMSVGELEVKLQNTRKLPKIVVPVHLAGQSCDMEQLHRLSEQYGFMILEDASHATGAEYQGRKVGNCQFSDMTVFSFHPVKIITTGEGGMVLTNDKKLYERLRLYRSHGITRDPACMTHASEGPWYYQQVDLGFNYRMTDLQAALGCSQMDSLDKFVARRRYLVERYNQKLQGLPLRIPYRDPATNPSWHIYIVRLDLAKITLTKKEIFAKMKAKGIVLNLHYIPVHTQPYYQQLGFKKGDFPVSERYYQEAMTLPLYYDLTDAEQDQIVEALRQVLLN